MADKNGQLASNELAPIAAMKGGRLRKDAAAALNALHAKHPLQVRDAYRPLGSPGDLARGVWSQWAAWERYKQGGNLAAEPGTSNHGWGTAIDCENPADRQIIDRFGAAFGFSKQWSDAPTEWWHILFKTGVFVPPKVWTPNLRQGSRGPNVALLCRRLFRLGYLADKDRSWKFTPAVESAVRAFQRGYHLPVDGIVGPMTWYAIKRAHKHR